MMRLACLLGVAAGLTLGAARAADDRVGVNTHFGQDWKPAEMMPLLDELGAGWIRDGVGWGDVEPSKHRYVVPAKTAAWLNAAHAHHLHVLLILDYSNKNYADPFSPPDYAKAAAFLAKTLAGRIDAIEILNEPNNPPFYPAYGGAWNGNEPDGKVSAWVKKYAELIQAAVPAIKAANPHMKVVGYGAPAPATFRLMRLGAPPQLDGITDHPYFGSMLLPEFVPYPATPDLLQRDGIATADLAGTYRSQCAMFRAEAAKDGLPHAALWNTEWGCASWINEKGNPPFSILPDAQAVYVLRRLLEARALGVMTFYYDLRDDGNDRTQEWENFGLLDYFHQPKKAFAAFRRFTAMFAGLEGDPAPNDGSQSTRLYSYHRAGSTDQWYACWKIAPFPGPASAAPPPALDIITDRVFQHATATNLYDGQVQELAVRSPSPGHCSFQVTLGPVPVVVHLHD